jgi:pyridinium-3,5-biscarboxylic acid mononucleotide synthase
MLSEQSIRQLLHRVCEGQQSVEEAMCALRVLPFEDLGHAKVDHHRVIRRGHPEVIYCAGKTPQQVAEIAQCLAARSTRILGTRATPEQFDVAQRLVPGLQYDACARALWLDREPNISRMEGVALLAAGTTDLPVAQEAVRTLEIMGQAPTKMFDVGVAGLQRVLATLPQLRSANVVIVVAGMEGALPGVVAGLIAAPVIAVPSSVGYGASFGGLAALLGMLNSCSPGISVVNIDNGFGAAYQAAVINSAIVRARKGAAVGNNGDDGD